MKGGARIALGVGIGYFLGRTRKMRWAMGLAGAAMTKRSTGLAGELIERGASTLGGTAELSKITDTVRGELLGAVRSAAVTAASNRLDAFNERLQLPVSTEDEDGGGRRRAAAKETEDAEPEPADEETGDETDESPDEEEPDEEEADEPAPRPRARRSTASGTSRSSGTRTSARSSGSAGSRNTAARRRRATTDTDEAPVRRTRR
ncbi:MAG: hypothetical protein HOQ36_10585 [Nocardia sp.]|nr:hypothetical protein [Nocardia sp.]